MGTILLSKTEQNMLYIVGKLIPWGIRESLLTRVKVSFERVTALLRRVTVTCIPTFHRIATSVTSKISTLRITFTALLHNN